jgi:small-conductance mechanosensitive channel
VAVPSFAAPPEAALEVEMQETSVGWEPMYEGHPLPWFSKLFVLYLALALFVSVFRAISVMRRLWWRQETQQETEGFHLTQEFCQARTASIKRLSMLTFLLSLLVFALNITKILQGVAAQKMTGSAFLAGAMAETFTTFLLGILMCAVLYVLTMCCEGMLARRTLQSKQSKTMSQPPAE